VVGANDPISCQSGRAVVHGPGVGPHHLEDDAQAVRSVLAVIDHQDPLAGLHYAMPPRYMTAGVVGTLPPRGTAP
jgi:hypothetical protein